MYGININDHPNFIFKALFIYFQLLYTNIVMAEVAAENINEEIRNYKLFYSTDRKEKNHNVSMEVDENKNMASTESPYFGMHFDTANEDTNDVSMEDQTWIENFELRLSEESDSELTHSHNDHCSIGVDTPNIKETNNNHEITFQNNTTLETSQAETRVESSEKNNVSMETSTRRKRKIKRRLVQNQKTLFHYSYQISASLDRIRSSFVESINRDASGTLIDVTKLVSQLMRSRVVLEKLPESIVKEKFKSTVMYNHYCTHCNKLVDNETTNKMKNKCKICDNQLQFQCNNCKVPLGTFKLTIVHLRDCFQMKTRNLLYNCPGCDYTSNMAGNVFIHVTKYHPEFVANEIYICEKCQKKYRKYYFFKKHIRTCTVG